MLTNLYVVIVLLLIYHQECWSVCREVSDESGHLGYCWMHHFKCHSARSCHTWAKGGPIKDDKISYIWGKKAFSK